MGMKASLPERPVIVKGTAGLFDGNPPEVDHSPRTTSTLWTLSRVNKPWPGCHSVFCNFLCTRVKRVISSIVYISTLDDSKLTSLPPSMPTPVALFDQLSDSLARLESRVRALEQSRPPASTPSDPHSPPRSTDPFSNHMIVLATAAGFTRTLFTRCPPDYYEWPLERRRRLLNAVSLHHLTKSIVLENTRHSGPHDENADVVAARYICCVVPYTAKINSDLLRDAVRRDGMKRGVKVPGVRGMNWRLAGDCNGVTGYEPNAVTPLGIRTRMPVVVAKQVAQLEPGEFWLGGGAVSLKWRVEWEEFRKVFSPIVLDFAEVEEGY